MTITSHGVPSMRLPFRGCQKVRRDSWAYWMEYPCERFCFQVQGYNIPIRNEILANALVKLSEKKRDIILLAYFLDMTDQEIADKLDMVRYTVQRRRAKSLKELKKEMEVDSSGEQTG